MGAVCSNPGAPASSFGAKLAAGSQVHVLAPSAPSCGACVALADRELHVILVHWEGVEFWMMCGCSKASTLSMKAPHEIAIEHAP